MRIFTPHATDKRCICHLPVRLRRLCHISLLLSEFGRFLTAHLVANLVSHAVVILVLLFKCYGVASRIVKHYNVAEFNMAQTFNASVVPMRIVKVAFAVD